MSSEREIEQAAAIVERARELCGEGGGWTRRAFARNRHRNPVRVDSPSAVRFCAAGGLLRAAGELLLVDDVDRLLDRGAALPEPLRLALACTGEVFGLVLVAWRIGYRQVDGQPQLCACAVEGSGWRPYSWLEVIALANDANGMRPDIVGEAFTAGVIWLRARRPRWLFDQTTPGPGGLGEEGS